MVTITIGRKPRIYGLRYFHRWQLMLTPPILLDEVVEVQRGFGAHDTKVLAPVAFNLGGVAHVSDLGKLGASIVA